MTLEAETADINTVAGLVEDVATLDLQVQAPNKFLYVIAFSLGRPSSAGHEFSFDITDPDMCRLLKWVNRSSMRLSYVFHSVTYDSVECGDDTGNSHRRVIVFLWDVILLWRLGSSQEMKPRQMPLTIYSEILFSHFHRLGLKKEDCT